MTDEYPIDYPRQIWDLCYTGDLDLIEAAIKRHVLPNRHFPKEIEYMLVDIVDGSYYGGDLSGNIAVRILQISDILRWDWPRLSIGIKVHEFVRAYAIQRLTDLPAAA